MSECKILANTGQTIAVVFRMEAIDHLGFVECILWPITKSTGRSLLLYKIWLEWIRGSSL